MPRLPAELVPTIPESARVVLRNTVWAYGKATSSVRPLPDFLVIGAQKAGTTALYAYLRWHPGIGGPSWKEVSFFDRHYRRGEAWYRGHFPNALRGWIAERSNGRPLVVGEASPSYMFHPLAPQRVHDLVPDVRLIALLRNPADRAYSHYQHEVALGREPLSFEQALDAEEERLRGEVERMTDDPSYFSHEWWDHTYPARGRYAEQLERWFAVFPARTAPRRPERRSRRPSWRDLRRNPRARRRRGARARILPAALPPRVLRDEPGDARTARRLLRRAQSPSHRAARARLRLDLSG